MNNHTAEGLDFFGVEIELLKIDDSLPAPHFKLVAQPNDWAETVREKASPASTERGERYRRFFTAVLTRFKAAHPGVTSTSRVGTDNWLGFAGGRTGFSFTWSIAANGRMRSELYIDTGDRASSKGYFDALFARREELEAQIGSALDWDRLDIRRACRISLYGDVAPKDLDENEPAKSWMVSAMERLVAVFRPAIQGLSAPQTVQAVNPEIT